MDATQLPENLGTRPEQEVIGVREEDFRTGVRKGLRELRFDRGLRAHWHEERRLDLVVQRAESRGASARAGGDGFNAKRQSRSPLALRFWQAAVLR